jgi:formylglycine-generating enzyme required for sulfatase activity
MRIFACFALTLFTCLPCSWGATPVDTTIFSAGPNGVKLSWNVIPGRTYLVQSTTNLSAPWQNAMPAPSTLTSTTNFIAQIFPPDSSTRFFRVSLVDTIGPDIYRMEPGAGGIAVGRQAEIRAWLRDDTGIATNTITLTVADRPPVVFGDPRLRFADGLLTYTPGAGEFLGAAGDTVTVSLAAADTLGNQTTNFAWSFQLGLPVIPSTNIVFVGGGGAAAAPARVTRSATAQPPPSLTLLSTNGNAFSFSYTGVSSGLTPGQFLVNTNLVTGYTRAVVSFTENTANHTVVVITRPARLAELLQQGSFSAGSLVEIQSTPTGLQSAGKLVDAAFATGLGLNFNFDLAQTVYDDGVLNVELLPGSFLNLSGRLDLDVNIKDSRLREFETKVSGTSDFRLEARATASGALNRTPSVALIKPVHQLYGGFIGALPVWVELVYEINLGCDLHLEAQASYTQGLSGTKDILVGRRYTEAGGWTTSFENPPAGFTVLGPTWQVETTGNLRLNLQPKVTAYIYSTAGVSLDLQPYGELTGRAQANPHEWELSWYGGLSSTLGLDLSGWDETWAELPSVSFDLIPRTLLWHIGSLAGAPEITTQPKSQLVRFNDTASLSVEAIGETPLIYRWFKDGRLLTDDFLITGSRTPFLRVKNVKAYDEGDYQVEVSNAKGRKMSDRAKVQIYFEPDPSVQKPADRVVSLPGDVKLEMVGIPAGTFTMGSPANEVDRHPDEGPQTQVTISHGFWMGKYEVTQSEYLNVTGSNPSSFRGDVNRPVETVSWNDAISYCSKLTERERTAGRLPSGYVYRLPTEAEWEYAARAGSVTRFSYGDDPGYTKLNDYAWSLANSSNTTHPVGQKLANDWGLYDMTGNVREWCLDRYGTYPGGSVKDPRGPASGSYRVYRGGSWLDFGWYCRSALRLIIYPDIRYDIIGFRVVLAPGQ